ncbi:MAG: acyl-CoA carboxylase subunit beta, partial [Calditrichaeota bacterium]|nr:acyl-CoA carboxylase subunit beta [Calditrichota bacterium]
MPQIGREIKKDTQFQQNYDHYKKLLKNLQEVSHKIDKGGGEKYQQKIKEQGKFPVRERIRKLIDKKSAFLEIGEYAAYGMYEEYGGAASSGTVFGIGKIHGRETVIVCNDPTVKAGAWFPITCKKNLRAQEISMENRLPIVYLVDSAGIFLPLQEDLFPDKEHFGRIFRNNAIMSSMGIPQIAAILGNCVAGGAYLPIMSDEALIVEGNGTVFLAGAHLVKAAIGERIDNQDLGGAAVHSEISGVTDYKVSSEAEAFETVRNLIDKLGTFPGQLFDRQKALPPLFDPDDIYGIIPSDRTRPYDMHQVLARILDGSEIEEYKAGYGKTIVTGYGRIEGYAVGIVANQRLVVRNKQGEMQIGGVIYSDSADKAARFIMNCNQKRIPLVFIQDVTGFMVGKKAEHGGILKDGAKLVNAVANSGVPKFTFIVGNSFGAGNYAMCGKAYDPRLIFALPSANIAVMGGQQASNTLLSIRLSQLKKSGKQISDQEKQELLQEIQDRYASQMDPLYAAARLWVDGIVDPKEIRSIVATGIRMA